MSKKKTHNKLLNPGAFRAGKYRTVQLPSGHRMQIRPLHMAELAELVMRNQAAGAEVLALADTGVDISGLRSAADVERIPAFLALARDAACAVAVTPKLTAEPTTDPGKLYVRDLSFDDLDALFTTACDAGGINAEALGVSSRIATTPPPLSVADHDAAVNRRVAGQILGFIKNDPAVTAKEALA